MRKIVPFLIVSFILITPGCKKKKNDIIHEAYEEPLKQYKKAKKKIKSIEKEHLKQLNSIEDSLQ